MPYPRKVPIRFLKRVLQRDKGIRISLAELKSNERGGGGLFSTKNLRQFFDDCQLEADDFAERNLTRISENEWKRAMQDDPSAASFAKKYISSRSRSASVSSNSSSASSSSSTGRRRKVTKKRRAKNPQLARRFKAMLTANQQILKNLKPHESALVIQPTLKADRNLNLAAPICRSIRDICRYKDPKTKRYVKFIDDGSEDDEYRIDLF